MTETIKISQQDANSLAECSTTIEAHSNEYGTIGLYSNGAPTPDTDEAATSLSWDSMALEGVGSTKRWGHIGIEVEVVEDGMPTDVIDNEPSISDETAGTLLKIANDEGGNEAYQQAALNVLETHGYNVETHETYIFVNDE